jgi:hypothetical protein
VKALDDLPQPLHFGAQSGHIGLKLSIPRPEIDVLACAIGRVACRRHGRTREPDKDIVPDALPASGILSVEVERSADIMVSRRAASGVIDRFGGGTRPMTRFKRWGCATPIPRVDLSSERARA